MFNSRAGHKYAMGVGNTRRASFNESGIRAYAASRERIFPERKDSLVCMDLSGRLIVPSSLDRRTAATDSEFQPRRVSYFLAERAATRLA